MNIKGLLYWLLTRGLLPTGKSNFSKLLANSPAESRRGGSVCTSIFRLPLGLGSGISWVFVCKAHKAAFLGRAITQLPPYVLSWAAGKLIPAQSFLRKKVWRLPEEEGEELSHLTTAPITHPPALVARKGWRNLETGRHVKPEWMSEVRKLL